MNIRKSIIMALAGGSVAIAASGAALAAAPTLPFGGNGFTIDNGSFDAGDLAGTTPCPADSTCSVYEGGSGTDGLLQRQVVYTNPTNPLDTATYIQAIVAETGVEEYVTGEFTDQTFANEQIVRMDAGSGGGNNIAQKMIMHEDNPTVDGDEFSGTHTMLGADYYDGGDLFYALDQSVGMGGTAGAQQLTRIRGEIAGGGAQNGNLNGNAGALKRIGIDQTGTGTPTGSMGDFVFRSQIRDFSAPQLLELPDESGGTQSISTGTTASSLQALFIDGPNGADPFDFQRFAANVGIDGDLTAANVIEIDNANPEEAAAIGTGPWNWGGGSVAEGIFGAVDDTTSSAIDLWDYN